MYLLTLLALYSCVLLESNASALSSTDSNCTATFRGFSFAAKATASSDKGSTDNHTLLNEANMEYTGKVTVGGHDFTLLIDTGSSDLWVTSSQKIKLNSTSNTTVNLTYGIGSAYGTVAYAPVVFGDYAVDDQAFLSVSKTDNQDAQGILGLGLNHLSVLARATKNASAQSVMANLFTQHPTTPHLIGLTLERSEDGAQTTGGYLSIGEYDPRYANVSKTPKIPVTPASSARWTIPLDAMVVNDKRVPLSSVVKGTKKGQAIALIDSGTSLAYIPSDAVDALYGQFNGSVHVKTTTQDTWYLPCLAQANVSFMFGNISYAINPVELSSPVRVVNQDSEYTVCVNTFRPPLTGNEHDLDFLLGDIFMRNVYSVFNFGNASAEHGDDAKGASIQLFSRTNRDQVYANFAAYRKGVLRVYPPLFDLDRLHTNGSVEGGGRLQPPPY